MKEKDFLSDAVEKDYHNYSEKGLDKRAQPFLAVDIPKVKKNLLVVGVALGGYEEVLALNKFFPEYQVYGIDVVNSSLNQKINAKLSYSDVADMKFKDGFFSGILCSAVMHEVFSYSLNGKKKVERAISEISRCLTKDGVCAIREFFVPPKFDAKLICLTKEAAIFAKFFIKNFRKSFDSNIRKRFIMKKNLVYSNSVLLSELLLHFRVFKDHFPNLDSFLGSKEIEESYLPLSLGDYSQILWNNRLEIIRYDYIDFPNYYNPINSNYKMVDINGKEVDSRFGFVDIVFKKK